MNQDEPEQEPPSCDEALAAAVAEWRTRHRLREDDAVLLLVGLFRIHQQHWDDLRRREMPSFGSLQADIRRFLETNRTCQRQVVALTDQLRSLPPASKTPTVTRIAAWLAALAGSLAGYLLGKAWP
jgi:hypothetical protein